MAFRDRLLDVSREATTTTLTTIINYGNINTTINVVSDYPNPLPPQSTPPQPTGSGGHSANSGNDSFPWGALIGGFFIGLIAAFFIFQPRHSSPATVLVPATAYPFESDSLSGFSLFGSAQSFASLRPGYDSDKSLQVNVNIAPDASGWGQAGIVVPVLPPASFEAVTARVLVEREELPQEVTLYALFSATRQDGTRITSAHITLVPGEWTPIFASLRGSGDTGKLTSSVMLWFGSQSQYKGSIYVDDLNYYSLATPDPEPTRMSSRELY